MGLIGGFKPVSKADGIHRNGAYRYILTGFLKSGVDIAVRNFETESDARKMSVRLSDARRVAGLMDEVDIVKRRKSVYLVRKEGGE